MILSPSILNRPAIVGHSKQTVKDHTAGTEVTVVGAHVGGLFRTTVYLTVLQQFTPQHPKFLYTYPARSLFFNAEKQA